MNHYHNEGVTPILMLPTISEDLSMFKHFKFFCILEVSYKMKLCKIHLITLEILGVPTPKNAVAYNNYWKLILITLIECRYSCLILICHFFGPFWRDKNGGGWTTFRKKTFMIKLVLLLKIHNTHKSPRRTILSKKLEEMLWSQCRSTKHGSRDFWAQSAKIRPFTTSIG